jgi:hypothetical protein
MAMPSIMPDHERRFETHLCNASARGFPVWCMKRMMIDPLRVERLTWFLGSVRCQVLGNRWISS